VLMADADFFSIDAMAINFLLMFRWGGKGVVRVKRVHTLSTFGDIRLLACENNNKIVVLASVI
jgi:hypothetical protein